jgi:hypothetical protein
VSVLNAHQRAVVRADTGIDPLIIDRCCDAFDALVQRGDGEAYQTYMGTAIAQMGMSTVRAQDRPTAVDKCKTIIQHALADEWHCSFREANRRLRKMLQG